MFASKQFRLAIETEEERRARLENDAATKRLKLVMESCEDGSYHTAQVGPGSRGRKKCKKWNGLNLDWIGFNLD